MKRNHRYLTAALAALSFAAGAPTALASSHREAPAISDDPAADNTDVWAWVKSGTHDKFYIVASFNPFEEPSGGPNFHRFSDDVLYEFHIARGAASLADVVTYQFRFKTPPLKRVDVSNLTLPPGGGKEFFIQLTGQDQTVDVWRIDGNKAPVQVAKDVPVAPPRIGAFTFTNFQKPAYDAKFGKSFTAYDDTFAAAFNTATTEGGRVWAGPRDDGFYVDLGGVFDAAQLRAKGTAQDGVAGFNCHTIALEVPTNTLTGTGQAPGSTAGNATTLGVWASASRRQVSIIYRNGRTDWLGPWVQVSRLGLPLINEAVIGYQDKDRFNRTRPSTDFTNFGAYFLNPIVVRDAEAVGIYTALGVDPTPFKSGRTDILQIINLDNIPAAGSHSIPLMAGITGDVLRVDMAVDSGFPNGRPIYSSAKPNTEPADVTDVLLSVLLAKGMVSVKDGVDYNDKNFLPDMPFLALPWDGGKEGHGKPTP